MTTHRLQCKCAALVGEVDASAVANRCTCYCRSCQAFPHALGCAERVLDARGGTDIVQVVPQGAVRFTKGGEHLACLRLTANGTLRWYAACCGTPLGNTIGNHRVSFVGLIHDCLRDPTRSLDASFGPSRGGVFTQYAIGEPKPELANRLGAAWRMGRMLLHARLSGAYEDTPFFTPDGTPAAPPRVLTAEEWRSAMAGVDRFAETHTS